MTATAGEGGALAVVAAGASAVGGLANVTRGLLAEMLLGDDVERALQVVVASASVLNAPNCSIGLGVDVTCGTLNRETCAVNKVRGARLGGTLAWRAGWRAMTGRFAATCAARGSRLAQWNA